MIDEKPLKESNVNTLKSNSFSVLPSLPESQPLNAPVIVHENWFGTLMTIIKRLKFENMIAGISGGTISTLVLHPLDLLKIRFAVNDGKVTTRPQYKGIKHALKTIVKEEGVRGLYKGVTPNWMGAGFSWGFYFYFYNAIKEHMLREKIELTAMMHLIAAAESSILTLTLTNPLWVVKTRLCLQYGKNYHLTNLPPYMIYRSTFDAFHKIYKYEGIRGLYKGYVPGLFGVTHGSLQFMAYEELRKMCEKSRDSKYIPRSDNLKYIFCAALSKLFASIITYPYQVARARLQDQHCEYNGLLDVINKTFRREGIKGYYKGLYPTLLKVVPQTCIIMTVIENVKKFLLSL